MKVKRPFALRLCIIISFVIMWSAQATLKICRISSFLMFLHQDDRDEYSTDMWPSGSPNSAKFTRRKSNVLCLSKYSSFYMIENLITYFVENCSFLCSNLNILRKSEPLISSYKFCGVFEISFLLLLFSDLDVLHLYKSNKGISDLFCSSGYSKNEDLKMPLKERKAA